VDKRVRKTQGLRGNYHVWDKVAHLDTLITHLEEHVRVLTAERDELSLHLPTTENIDRAMSWGWTQHAMAKYFCVSQPTIHRYQLLVKRPDKTEA